MISWILFKYNMSKAPVRELGSWRNKYTLSKLGKQKEVQFCYATVSYLSSTNLSFFMEWIQLILIRSG